jgi:hypothetical protein
LMMGDGWLDRGNVNPSLACQMITPAYLEYVDDVFRCLGIGVRLRKTAEENAKHNRDRGFRPDARAQNYSDTYRWRSRTHPELTDFDWYTGEGGEKVWPADLELTPTVLKHWYCGDGNWSNSGSNNYIRIAMSNEVEYTDKIDKYFERVGLPKPNNYNIQQRKSGGVNCDALFTVGASKELWDYMGSPPPGFEYKWPKAYR